MNNELHNLLSDSRTVEHNHKIYFSNIVEVL